MTCASCQLRWLSNGIWYCRRNSKTRKVDLPVIGNYDDLKKAKGCGWWQA